MQVGAGGEQFAGLGLERGDERVDISHVFHHARAHLGLNGGEHQMHGRLLTAARARAVAPDHGAIVALLQEKGREHSHVRRGLDEAVIGVGQTIPQRPVATQSLQSVLGLPGGDEGPFGADLDTDVAALAGLGIDGDREQAPRPLGLRFEIAEVGTSAGQRELGQADLHPVELGVGRGATLGVPAHLRGHRVVGEGVSKGRSRFLVLLQELVCLLRPVLHQRAKLLQTRAPVGRVNHRGQHLFDGVHETEDRGIRTLGEALTAARATGSVELGNVEPCGRHVPRGRGGGRDGPDGGEGIGDAVKPQPLQRTHLLPEAPLVPWSGHGIEGLDENGHVRHIAPLVIDLRTRGRDYLHFPKTPTHHPHPVSASLEAGVVPPQRVRA